MITADVLMHTLIEINNSHGQGDIIFADLGLIHLGRGWVRRKGRGVDIKPFVILGSGGGTSRAVRFLKQTRLLRPLYPTHSTPPPVIVVQVGAVTDQRYFQVQTNWISWLSPKHRREVWKRVVNLAPALQCEDIKVLEPALDTAGDRSSNYTIVTTGMLASTNDAMQAFHDTIIRNSVVGREFVGAPRQIIPFPVNY